MEENEEVGKYADRVLEEMKRKSSDESKGKKISEIIDDYNQLKSENSEEAILFILREFQGEKAHTLNKRYLGLFMLNENSDGYDPINRTMYQVDPEVESLDFEPKSGEFILFHKEGKHADSETSLEHQGKLTYIQRLQVVGTEEILDAPIYDPKQNHAKSLRQLYGNYINYADNLKFKSTRNVPSF